MLSTRFSLLPFSHSAGIINVSQRRTEVERLSAGVKLAFIKSGQFDLVVNEQQKLHVEAGKCYCLSSQTHWQLDHDFFQSSSIEYVTIDLQHDFVKQSIAPFVPWLSGQQQFKRYDIALDSRMSAIIGQLLSCPYQNAANQQLFKQAKSLELAGLVAERMVTEQHYGTSIAVKDVDRLKTLVERISKDLSCQYSTQQLANLSGFNIRKLNHLFYLTYECSAADYVRRIKMEKAWQLIVVDGLDVTNTALSIGYSLAHFSTLFQQYFGCAPSSLRH